MIDGQRAGGRTSRRSPRRDESTQRRSPRVPIRAATADVDRGQEGGDERRRPERVHGVTRRTCSRGSSAVLATNFDGHLVIRLSFSATKTPDSSSSPVTITSRPSRNGSGTIARRRRPADRAAAVAVGDLELEAAALSWPLGWRPRRSARRSRRSAPAASTSEGSRASVRCAERGVDQRHGEQDRSRERDDQPDLSLSCRGPSAARIIAGSSRLRSGSAMPSLL